jgi:signal transduction histidine kinase
MAALKRAFTKIFKPVRDFFIKHPAVLSGYIIYAYFFITTMGFYKDLKETHFKSFNIVERFDALIWMWLLAVVLVKVIEYRKRLTEQERLRLEHQKELEIKSAQVVTAHQMIRTLQHQINNPLTVILLYVQRALRKETLSAGAQESLTEIKNSAERISAVLHEFAHAQGIETVGSPVGNLVTPGQKHDTTRTMDEASPA